MKPLYLEIINFRSHRHSKIDFSNVSTALILAKGIKGNERKSNGIGKSTILQAIELCIYGEIPDDCGDTLDQLIRDGENRYQIVYVFEFSNNIYKIDRSFSKKSGTSLSFFLKKGDVWENKSGRTVPETQKEILKVIKINRKAFKNGVIFSHSDLRGLTSATSFEQRLAYLKDPLLLYIFSKLEKWTKEKYTELNKNKSLLESRIEILFNDLEKINVLITNNKIENNSKLLSELETLRIQQAELLSNVEKEFLQFKSSSLTQNLEKALVQIRFFESSLNSNNNSLLENSKNLSFFQKEYKHINENKIKIEEEFLKLKSELAFLNQEFSLLIENDIKKNVEKYLAAEQKGFTYLGSLRQKLAENNKALTNNEYCPHCEQYISLEYRKLHAEKHKENADKYQKAIKETLDKLNLIKIHKESADAKQKLFNDLSLKISSIKCVLQDKEKLFNKYKNESKTYQEKIQNLEKNINKINLEIEHNSHELNKLKNLNLLSHEEKVLEFENKILQIKQDEAKFQKQYLDLKVENQLFCQQIENSKKLEIELSDKIKELTKLKSEITIIQKLIFGFSTIIPNEIINDFLKELSVEGNNYLASLFPNCVAEFDWKNNELQEIYYKINNTVKRYYNQLSMGQRFRAALSFNKIGFASVIQKKLGIDLNLLIFDEADAPLDEEGIEAFLEIIKKLKDKFMILVISHNKALKNEFEHCIIVEEVEEGIAEVIFP